MKESPCVFQPSSFKKVVKTVWESAWGAKYTSGIRIAKNPRICKMSISPSILGKASELYC
jgi:hypothetical protein